MNWNESRMEKDQMQKRTKRGIIAALFLIIAVLTLAACTSGAQGGNGASTENTTSGSIDTHYQDVQPPYQPTGQSVYRQNLTEAEADQVLGLNTTTFFFSPGNTRTPFFWCPSHGGAVPNTAQLTDPDYVEPDPNTSSGNHSSIIIGNMDPDGVYSPSSSNGTYVLCVDSAGTQYLVYSEPDVLQISAPATWSYTADNGQGGIVVTGAPVMPVCTAETYEGKAATICTAPANATTPASTPTKASQTKAS